MSKTSIPQHFEISITDPKDTDLVIVSVKDKRTGYWVRTALPNHGVQTASIMAFAGARYSRSDLSAEGLFKEIKSSGKNASEKLANIFRNYGHASVADMAMLFAYIENVPLNYGMKFFYETSVGGGQERSTRYQDFSTDILLDLDYYKDYFQQKKINQKAYQAINNKFKDLQKLSINYYNKYKQELTESYVKEYDIDITDSRQKNALTARVFDSARYFLMNGLANRTSLAWITSAREWARLISFFKASKDLYVVYLGEQLEFLFAPSSEIAAQFKYTPEAPDLIRYTSADETTAANLTELKNLLDKNTSFKKLLKTKEFKFHDLSVEMINSQVTAGQKVLMQNILSIYPVLDYEKVTDWIAKLPNSELQSLINIVYRGYNHHKQMGNQFRVNEYSFQLTMSISEAKDLNRHRAWGRFLPMFSAEYNYYDLYNDGYTLPAYLTDNPHLKTDRQNFESDLLDYYEKLKNVIELISNETWFPAEIFPQLLPYGHTCRMFMHASPKEVSYFTKLRVRPGGHINYRIMAYLMAEAAGSFDKFAPNLALTDKESPDPSSREEFLDRG